MGIRETFGRSLRPVRERQPAAALARLASFVPPPMADLLRDIIYPERMPVAFDRIAIELGLLEEDEARRLRERANAEGRRFDELAIESDQLSPDEVQCVVDEQAFVVQVNVNRIGSPAFLTWIGELHRQGVFPKILRKSAQDLAKMREGSVTERGPEDVDLDTLNQARQILVDLDAVGASDLHVQVCEGHTELQARVKGDLKTCAGISLHPDQGERLIRAMCQGLATVKVKTYNPLDFQDEIQISGDALPRSDLASVRIIRGPSYPVEAGGSFLVARLQPHGNRRYATKERTEAARQRLELRIPNRPPGEFRLGSMGFIASQVEMLQRLMRRPKGILFVVGPTSSGKTTTLFEMSLELGRHYPGERLITIENPVEYPIGHAIQLQADSAAFPARVKSALRMDPDTILPSEVRGVDEAIAAVQAAQTGHRVLTTLHCDDPFEIFGRLELLDHVRLARGMICNHRTIVGMVAQRRVQILCPDCSQPFTNVQHRIPGYMLQALESWGDLSKMRARDARHDCPTCRGEGVIREQAVAEVVVTDEALMRDILDTNVMDAARRYRQRSTADKTMIEHAMDLVLTGQLDPEDAAKIDEIPMLEAQA
ncbi:ATPase, T2SS/T4P/T4SS family [Ralstonia chuxiongensis]|uniref:ATPase, T2SS/T4P/T4SS family n=1 Tax=Ralstonia chuxiongensis TaxID=2957504 RepID=UPI0028F4E952|nr:ATPase, T2SS/T4P/T4SS family [Ralstonia chuxiongensis]CAJ0781313.1 hypothetical protein R8510_04857 [Ralstonia chuxiongensis]